MRKFRALLSVNLKAMLLSTSNSRGRGRRRMSGVGMLILIAFLGLYLSGTYSFAFALQLAPVGMLDLLLMMMPVLVTAMGVFYTVMAVQGVVFGGKDNDLMLSLPIPAFQLMLARVLVLVLENLVFSYVILLPAGVAYAVFGGAAGPGFWLRLLAGAAVLSLLPTTLALVLGFLLTWLSGKFGRGKALLRNLLYLVFFGAVLVLAFQSGTLIGTLAEYAAGIQAGFAGWGLPFLLFQRGVCGDGLAFLATTALCLLPFLLAVWLFGQRYQHLVTSLTARASRADYKLVRQSGSSQRRALLNKEARRFFNSTMYLFNTGCGLILMLLLGGAALIKGRELTTLLALLGDTLPLTPLLALAILFCLSTAAISASSISLEGRYLWILREAPVDSRTVLDVKWGFQLLLTLPCTLVCIAAVTVGCQLPLDQAGALLLVSAAFALFHAPFGLYVNLCFPKLDAPNDTVVVKQSAAALLGTLVPMLLLGAAFVFYLLLHGWLGVTGTLLAFALVELAAAGVCIRLVRGRGAALLEALT